LRGMTSRRQRLDRLLAERGLAPSRQRAAALIIEGKVRVDGQRARKAGQTVAPDARVEVLEEHEAYVSRGGIKLAGALDFFCLSVAGFVAMDVGASTGGFTDCLLQRGVRRVYAVDVGYGQLAWKLRQDQRVVVLERTNVRYLTREEVPEPVDLATIDTSFISLTKVIPRVVEFLKEGGRLLALVKPQFEVGRGLVGKGGVVREPGLHQAVVSQLERFCRDQGLAVEGVTESPLLGPKGNREFFLSAMKSTP
jgi:23S rRNA (cytidine1920-2'-O)/16S rRNA (cytidine1409-2'-O)-methyltransferase